MRWAVLCVLVALAAQAYPSAAAQPVVVYGLELESRGRRLLVFAEAPLEYQLLEPDGETLVVSLPGAVLDPSAPRSIRPDPGGALGGIRAFDRADVDAPEVRIVIARATGAMPDVSQRGSILALDFAAKAAAEGDLALDFRDAEIAEVVRAVAAATGERFLFDERLRGRVTLIVADRVSPGEALELLHTALLAAGFAAVPAPGGALKILPIQGARTLAPLETGPLGDASDAPVTTLVRLEAVDAVDLASRIQPWVGSRAQALGYAPTNSLILAGSEYRLQSLLLLVRALDASAEEVVFVRRLRHSDAPVLAEILEATYAERAGMKGRLAIVPDERGNALIVRAPALLADELRERVDRLDRPVTGEGEVAVIPLHYVDPEDFAQLLRDLSTGAADEPRAAAGLQGREIALAVDAPTHSLVVRGDPDTLAVVREIVDELDRAPPRVSVELLVLEVTTDEALELGFDAFIPLSDSSSASVVIADVVLNPSGGGLVQPGAGTAPAGAARLTRDPLVIPIVDENGNPITLLIPRESFVITGEERQIASRVLLRPHLLVASGEEQEIFAGDNLPIPVSSAEQADPLQTRQDVQRQDVGVSLRVQPTIGEVGGLVLQLLVETTQLGEPVAGDVEVVGPTIEERHLETTVRLEDGQWAVVGLGHQPELQEQEVGTPFFKDIPVLGALFRRTEEMQLESHLVIAVQGRIQRSRDELLAETIRRRLGLERNLARTLDLREQDDGPVVLLVTTRTSQAEADAIAESFRAEDRPARVARWEWEGAERFDVYLTGFRSIAEAGAAAMPLLPEGWSPQIVVVPGAEPEPSSLHAQPSVPPTFPF